jgi:formate hydrogenlyase subunit 4
MITILTGLGNVALVLLLAPLFEGVLRKVTALIQSRQGPPVLQPYFDLLKLLGKEDLESGESPVMQRFAAYLVFATILTVAWLVPMGLAAPLNNAGDAMVLIYLLALCSLSTLLAGLAAGSTYSLMGISREMMSVVTLEPLLVVAIVVGTIQQHSLRLDAVLQSLIYTGQFYWSGLIMLGVLLLSFQAFVQRVPFDTAEAETELMDGPVMEYSGPKLALFKYARMAKLVIYSGLFVALFIPWGQSWVFPLNLVFFWAKVFVLVMAVTAVAATHARLRIDQAIRYYAGLIGAAFTALILAVFGY